MKKWLLGVCMALALSMSAASAAPMVQFANRTGKKIQIVPLEGKHGFPLEGGMNFSVKIPSGVFHVVRPADNEHQYFISSDGRRVNAFDVGVYDEKINDFKYCGEVAERSLASIEEQQNLHYNITSCEPFHISLE